MLLKTVQLFDATSYQIIDDSGISFVLLRHLGMGGCGRVDRQTVISPEAGRSNEKLKKTYNT